MVEYSKLSVSDYRFHFRHRLRRFRFLGSS